MKQKRAIYKTKHIKMKCTVIDVSLLVYVQVTGFNFWIITNILYMQ
jgi:hypothetical protein